MRERTFPRTEIHCRVCGFAEVRTDEVAGAPGGVVWLAECPRCAHRFTAPRVEHGPAPARALRRSSGVRLRGAA